MSRSSWNLTYGAELRDDRGSNGIEFSVAAPGKTKVEVAIANPNGYQFVALEPDGKGHFNVFIPGLGAGTRYKFRLDGDMVLPDPYTRSQPDDVHGDSEVVDPLAYQWHDENWAGLELSKMVIYELHVGTFTKAGTFAAIVDQLDYLLKLGINTIELLPIGEFPGRRNWGYDGVQYFAPDSAYGGYHELKYLIDQAHQRGLAVIVDVVYNHFGPDGNYLWSYSRDYFTANHKTPWGDAPNYDSVNAELMRSYVMQNALYWAHEFHVDGLRMDATFAMIDDSDRHILRELAHALHTNRRAEIPFTVIAEDHRNLAELHWPEPEGYGFDGQWVDDLHHAIHCYFTSENDGYYQNYRGTLTELIKTFNEGFLYQGEHYQTWNAPRGTPPIGINGQEVIVCIQNHDQVGNRAFGDRLNHLITRDAYHLTSALFLFSPFTPMLFMGQEYAAPQPFLFFTDHHEELGRAVTVGRREEFKDFSIFTNATRRTEIPDPQAEQTFLQSQLDLTQHQQEPYAGTFRLYQQLLKLTREIPALAKRERNASQAFSPIEGVMAFYRRDQSGNCFVIANLTNDRQTITKQQLPEELARLDWRKPLFSSLEREFGGSGLLPEWQQQSLSLPPYGLYLYKI